MSQSEREVAFREDHPYKVGVLSGYPLLIEDGKNLQAHGVYFHDLTMIFVNHDEVLYSDDCCHLTPEGYGMIGERIGQVVAEYFRQSLQ